MTIADGMMVSLEYTLTLEDQAVLDTNVGGAPLTFAQGSHKIIPGLEQALEGMKAGESKKVTVGPQDGYGEIDPRGFQEIPIDQIPPDARKVGMQLQGKNPEGHVIRPVVKEVKEHVVVLDFNHPLAGKTLYFDVKVLDVTAGTSP
ncbi:MAG: peptidylprolyl isomerase [Nitrospirales bacterium]|nr:peptidylprolyl isomerase [Nitrospirales bacterium]